MTTNDDDGLEQDPPTKFEDGVFNGESDSTAGSSDPQQIATLPSSQSNLSSEAQKLVDLQAEVRSVIEPFRKPDKKPPFSLAEIVVICLVIMGELSKEAIHFWMVTKFRYYAQKALAFHTKLGGASVGWGPTEEISVEFEKIFSELDLPIHRKIDGKKLPEGDPVKFPTSDGSKWALNSLSAARGYLHRFLRASSSQHFRLMDLPTELRLRIYEMALLLPRSGVNVNTGPYVEPTFSTFSKDYEKPFPGLSRWPGRITVWQLPRVSIRCSPPALHLALLQVSKQIYQEAMPVFYGDNLFVSENIGRLRDFLKRTPEARRMHIRYLAFSIEVGFKAELSKVAKMVAALPYLKELDIWIDEEHFKSVQVSTAGLPGFRISGFTALRSIPSLIDIRLHGNCPTIQEALEKLKEEAKAKAKAKEKAEKEKANKKLRAPRKRKAIAPTEEKEKAPRKRKAIASAESQVVEPGMSLQSGFASGLVSAEGGPRRLAVPMSLEGDPWGLDELVPVQGGSMGLGGIAAVQGDNEWLSGIVPVQGGPMGLGGTVSVQGAPRGLNGILPVQGGTMGPGEIVPVQGGSMGLGSILPVQGGSMGLGTNVPVQGGPMGLGGIVPIQGDIKGLGDSMPVKPVHQGPLGYMSVETHLGVLDEFIPVPYGLGGLDGHMPAQYDLAELGDMIPVDGQGDGDGQWPVYTPWWP
ncbi:hypothetical protein CB0940_11553 [Cercospora beticola]|uniref:DUF7730 domain-containing protein n=1 Tax=Cercospora beticola TaxID=122368 RepID=A0A2G5HED2_CERBT|nr:hypothetical protein CB0940_11553 [Cercospora beticola]PIA90897.1 hypothetical protein CB0940_11553 [Cercospora beticola]WPB08424.1 hypothetical protein RHO25_013090 [Cercospora beticola]CAK1367675.1 unnamed protein product [Cercospora beticola]